MIAKARCEKSHYIDLLAYLDLGALEFLLWSSVVDISTEKWLLCSGSMTYAPEVKCKCDEEEYVMIMNFTHYPLQYLKLVYR